MDGWIVSVSAAQRRPLEDGNVAEITIPGVPSIPPNKVRKVILTAMHGPLKCIFIARLDCPIHVPFASPKRLKVTPWLAQWRCVWIIVLEIVIKAIASWEVAVAHVLPAFDLHIIELLLDTINLSEQVLPSRHEKFWPINFLQSRRHIRKAPPKVRELFR